MRHVKFLVQRLTYMSWLLAAGLVLGWSGEVVAQTLTVRFAALPESHDGSGFTFEIHFSEEIEMGYVNMRDDVLDVTGGVVRSARRLTQGSNLSWELTIEPESNADVSITMPPSADCSAASAVCTTDGRALSNGLTAIVPGPTATAQADYLLSVNSASVREDAGETDIEVTVEVTDGTAVDVGTYVLLGVSHEGINSRFYIRLTVLRILAGEKKATGTLTLIPINDDIVDEDLPITIHGNAGRKTVESTTIMLVDDDKDSKNINLSADVVELNRFDGATEITVTATLDGKVLDEETSFSLIIGDHPGLENDPNTDIDADGDIDDADATKDNREAQRDLDYAVTLATLTIPKKSVSGRATITLTPRNRLPGTIRVESSDNDTDAPGIQIEDDGLTINPVDIKIKKESTVAVVAIALSQDSIREDAGETTVELNVTLTDALAEDAMVSLAVLPAGADLPSGGTVPGTPIRDVHYTLVFGPPLTIPAGATEGMTTFTITPTNDTAVAQRGEIYIQIAIGNVLTTKTIAIADDDANSMNISLTADPAEISEDAGTTNVAVTGTLDGKVFDDDVVVLLIIDPDPQDTDANGAAVDVAEATRDIDYSATLRPLTIPAGSVSGTTTITITPTKDRSVEADEKIRLIVPYANNQITAQYAEGDDVKVTVGIVDITLKDTGESKPLSFAEDATIADQTYIVGTAIADWVLPDASGGDGELTYNISALPAGLEFDAVTRTLGGTPVGATDGALTVTYIVTDNSSATAVLTFAITVNPAEASEVTVAGLTAVPAVVREDARAMEVSLTFTLEAASAADEVVRFAIVAPSDGPAAVRDVDYTAVLEALITIPAGATEGKAMLLLSPFNDDEDKGLKTLGVRGTLVSTGETVLTDIEIRDDETPSTSIALSASPSELNENAALTTIVVTATLDGKALAEDATVRLAIDDESTATRDLDYAALFTPMIEIPAGSLTGTTNFYVDPVADNLEEGDEVIRLIGAIDGLEGDEVEITLSESGAAKAAIQTRPEAFTLANNYPNPFNPTTTIQYALPQAVDVKLTVYNVVGQPVRTLVAEHQSAGRYAVEWDATNDSGHSLSAGMYFYRLQAGEEFRAAKKMLLLR